MATTLEQLTNDMKAAMRAREKQKLQTIRSLISSLKQAAISKGDELNEDDILGILSEVGVDYAQGYGIEMPMEITKL